VATLPSYQRRRPEQTALWQVVQRHLAGFLAKMEGAEKYLPKYVKTEFDKYLDCGILQKGFLHIRCSGCKRSRLLGFSCKSRSFCPSCVGRQMNEAALLWEESLMEGIPIRQYVLSLPYPLRYLLAHKALLCGKVLGIFVKAVQGQLKRRAKQQLPTAKTHTGVVTVVQRASSHLALNIHFHSLFTDGVYLESATGELTFHPLPPPSAEELKSLAQVICHRILRFLKRKGLLGRRWPDRLCRR